MISEIPENVLSAYSSTASAMLGLFAMFYRLKTKHLKIYKFLKINRSLGFYIPWSGYTPTHPSEPVDIIKKILKYIFSMRFRGRHDKILNFFAYLYIISFFIGLPLYFMVCYCFISNIWIEWNDPSFHFPKYTR